MSYKSNLSEGLFNKLSEFTKKDITSLRFEDIINLNNSQLKEFKQILENHYSPINSFWNKVSENFDNSWLGSFDNISPNVMYALLVSALEHRYQKRINGLPYFLHPMATAINLLKIRRENAPQDKIDEMFSAALLHDTLEDTSLTKKELRKLSNKMGLKNVYKIVVSLTRKKGEHGKNKILFDEIKNWSELEEAVDNYRFTKRDYYKRILDKRSLARESGREALIVKILDGANNANNTPIPLEYKVLVEELPENFPGSMYHFERIRWRRTELSYFVNEFLLPALSFTFAHKEEFEKIGIDSGRLHSLIRRYFGLNIDTKIEELPITSTSQFYKFRSSKLTDLINKHYKREGLKDNAKNALRNEYPHVISHLFVPQAYELVTKGKLNEDAIFYLDKRNIEEQMRPARSSGKSSYPLEFYIELPFIGERSSGFKIVRYHYLKVKKVLSLKNKERKLYLI